MNQNGFTLIEILVVLFIIAIVFTSTTVMLSQSQLSEKNNRVASQKLQVMLERLQTDAIIQGMPHRLLINQNQFVVEQFVNDPQQPRWQRVNFTASLPDGKVLLKSELPGQIRFNPDGLISPFQLSLTANQAAIHCSLVAGAPSCTAG